MTGRSEGQGSRTWLVVVITVVSVVSAAGVIAMALVAGTAHNNASSRNATAMPPMDITTVPAAIAGHYRFAADHMELYAQVPRFCGCRASLGHRDLRDCFVRADGSGWEAHASGCGVCIQESQAVRAMLARGRSPTDIRDAVMARFGPQPILGGA